LFFTPAVFADSSGLDSLFFSLSPKVMEDGSITDVSFGYRYTEDFAGELRLRKTTETKNEEFEGAEASLNAVSSTVYEAFFLPFELNTDVSGLRLRLGPGLYYYDETLKEKGFFDMAALASLGKASLNSYTNDFSMRLAGPLIDAGFAWHESDWFGISLSGGAVPIFYARTNQDVSITPLMSPERAEYSKSTSGSPYLYADISLVFFEYLSASLVCDYTRLKYNVLDFTYDGSDFAWYTPRRTVTLQSFRLEADLRIPLGAGIYLEIGGGRIFDSAKLDSGSELRTRKNYVTVSGRKFNF
jgi:hypothetical protein